MSRMLIILFLSRSYHIILSTGHDTTLQFIYIYFAYNIRHLGFSLVALDESQNLQYVFFSLSHTLAISLSVYVCKRKRVPHLLTGVLQMGLKASSHLL